MKWSELEELAKRNGAQLSVSKCHSALVGDYSVAYILWPGTSICLRTTLRSTIGAAKRALCRAVAKIRDAR